MIAFAIRAAITLVFAVIPVGRNERRAGAAGLTVIVTKPAFAWAATPFVVRVNVNAVSIGKRNATARMTGKRVVRVTFAIVMSVVNAVVIAVCGISVNATARLTRTMVVRVMPVRAKRVVPVSAFAEIGNC
jgi:hypothetical protein